jgi:uncharacterized small protein (DUF1192 family)
VKSAADVAYALSLEMIRKENKIQTWPLRAAKPAETIKEARVELERGVPGSAGTKLAVIALTAVGLTPAEISDSLGLTPSVISAFLADTEVLDRVGIIQTAIARTPEQRLSKLLPAAVDTIARSLLNSSVPDTVRFKAAQDILNRNMGTPIQTVATISSVSVTSAPDAEIAGRLAALQQRLARLEEQKSRLLSGRTDLPADFAENAPPALHASPAANPANT